MAACSRCGTQLPPAAVTCTGCGLPVGAAPPPPPPTAQPAGAPPPAYVPPPPGGAPYGQPQYGGFPGGYPPPWAQQQGTDGLAIASLVLGILWFWGVGSVLAVIFGHLGRRQIRERGGGGSGLATAGLVLGYLGIVGAIVITASLIAIGKSAVDSFHSSIQVQDDLRNLATAEEQTLTNTGSYSNSAAVLAANGFQQLGSDPLYAGYDGRISYCLIGSIYAFGTWSVYDSARGGIAVLNYSSINEAEQSCSNGVTNFAPV